MTLKRVTPNSTSYPSGIGEATYAGLVATEIGEISKRIICELGGVGGTATAITASVVGADALTALVSPMTFWLTPASDVNAAATLAIDGLPAVAIRDAGGTVLGQGGMKAGRRYLLSYDGTNLRIVGGGGDVSGIAPSVAGNIPVYTDTGGKEVEDSGVAVSTDGTFAANSDAKLPTEKAVKTYVDALLGVQDAMIFKGVIDCSANPNYPAADRGHTYRVSVAGKIGGGSGPNVEVGDLLICITDSTASGDHATVGANWAIIQVNLDGAVIGPASVTDSHFAQFDGISGKLIKGGVAPDTDTALAANSDTRIATQKAVKTYVDAIVDGAPSDLNTLNEIAASIDDDPDFAGTMTTALAGKLNASALSTATDLGGATPSNSLVPSQAAVKSYVDTDAMAAAVTAALLFGGDETQAVRVLKRQSDIYAVFGVGYWADDTAYDNVTDWLNAAGGSFTRASTKWVMGSNGLLTSVASGAIAIEYDSDGIPIGALLEGARTNLALNSQDVSGYSSQYSSVTANSHAAPDGTTTADTISNNDAAQVEYHYRYQSITTVVSTVYTQSWWVKKKTGSGIVWMLGQASNSFCYFNLTTGAVGTSTGWTNPKIEAFPDGWYRISATQTANTTGYVIGIGVCLADGTPNWDSTGLANTQEVYVWGAQFEAGAHASSYIPTTSGSVTRAADVLSFPFTATTASFFTHTKNAYRQPGTNSAFLVGNQAGNAPLYAATDDQVLAWNGAAIMAKGGLTGTWLSARKSAIAGNPSARSLTANGLTPATDANALWGTSPTSLLLGHYSTAAHINGHLIEFAAWPGTKLSDAALQALTA